VYLNEKNVKNVKKNEKIEKRYITKNKKWTYLPKWTLNFNLCMCVMEWQVVERPLARMEID
jgi:hypothetical protein